jgi:hypothetical protein
MIGSLCTFCDQRAGWFKTDHPACRTTYDQIVEMTVQAIADGSLDTHQARLGDLVGPTPQTADSVRRALVTAWTQAVDRALEDGVLAEGEEAALTTLVGRYGLTEVTGNETHHRFVKSAVLREVLAGRLPTRINVNGQLPFNFQSGETLVWLWQNVAYHEERIQRSYVGGSQGLSVRVMKGVYYRTSAFKGHPVETAHMPLIDTGTLAATDRHIYSAGARKSLRIPYDDIVSFTPYDTGIGIGRDGARAKPQVFVTNDGWFTCNLIQNLAQRARDAEAVAELSSIPRDGTPRRRRASRKPARPSAAEGVRRKGTSIDPRWLLSWCARPRGTRSRTARVLARPLRRIARSAFSLSADGRMG